MKQILRMHAVAILLLALVLSFQVFGQQAPTRVEPPHWWSGMAHKELQLLVYAPEIGLSRPEINHQGIRLKEVVTTENPNYLFLYLDLSEAGPGSFRIDFRAGRRIVYSYDYQLHKREAGSAFREGVNASDAIYLLMPDRFANGDPSNDQVPGMLEGADINNPDGRHGGDIEGIARHLDYIADMGFTALWINPLLENNQPRYSYHGYAITDFYRTDPRFGSNEQYRQLVSQAGEKGLKIIKDMVFNHCGHHHWWMRDLPSHDWINQWPEFTRTSYRMTTIVDPHGSDIDYAIMMDGWFDTNMPDLNQRNRLLATYLIQNSVWWIEYAGLRGIRMDTQPYADKHFMADWGRYVMTEYPDFLIIGEAWMGLPAMVSYFQGGKQNHDGYDSHIPSVFDFALYDDIGLAFNEEPGWASGLMRLYNTLAQDFLYADPYNLVIFGDNHDTDRFFTRVDEDLPALKMALSFIFTTRGIPQLYAGTELLESAFEHDGHGLMRTRFPGGWPGDAVNAFTREGRTPRQNQVYDHIKQLLEFRRENPVLHYGWLRHFVPRDNVYVYFRYLQGEAVMVILNANHHEVELDMARFQESWQDYRGADELFSGASHENFDRWRVPARSSMVWKLR